MNIFAWLRARWIEYKENQKWREFYARLDRNAEGKFTKTQYMRDFKKVKSAEKKRK